VDSPGIPSSTTAHSTLNIIPTLPNSPSRFHRLQPNPPPSVKNVFEDREDRENCDGLEQKDFGKKLVNLAKIYAEDNKYSGENDNFDLKLVIFHDLCGRTSVPDKAKVKAYLRGLALDHYYTNLKNAVQAYTPSFDQICEATRSYFEGPEYSGILG
jgi:hypothetical protein